MSTIGRLYAADNTFGGAVFEEELKPRPICFVPYSPLEYIVEYIMSLGDAVAGMATLLANMEMLVPVFEDHHFALSTANIEYED